MFKYSVDIACRYQYKYSYYLKS